MAHTAASSTAIFIVKGFFLGIRRSFIVITSFMTVRAPETRMNLALIITPANIAPAIKRVNPKMLQNRNCAGFTYWWSRSIGHFTLNVIK
jgi:hypothetical protein